MPHYSKREQTEARESLARWIKPGDRLFTILRHKSDSGMSRVIQVVKPTTDDEGRIHFLYLGYSIARLLNEPYDNKHEGVRVTGAGMDMGFDLVYRLSCRLYCPENYDHDAAYSLKHEWL